MLKRDIDTVVAECELLERVADYIENMALQYDIVIPFDINQFIKDVQRLKDLRENHRDLFYAERS